jgi:hypothetical protein
MSRRLAALLAFAIALPALAADPAAHIQLVKVEADKAGTIDAAYTLTVQKIVNVTVNKEVNGKQVPVTEQKVEEAKELMKVRLTAKEYKATTTDGKEIAAADLEKRLKGGAVVALSWGGVPADLRKVFKDDTVFIERLPGILPVPK